MADAHILGMKKAAGTKNRVSGARCFRSPLIAQGPGETGSESRPRRSLGGCPGGFDGGGAITNWLRSRPRRSAGHAADDHRFS